MPVELHRSHPVDGIAPPQLSNAVVALCRDQIEVVHQFAQHIDRNPGIGMPLGIGVSVGVGNMRPLSNGIVSAARPSSVDRVDTSTSGGNQPIRCRVPTVSSRKPFAP